MYSVKREAVKPGVVVPEFMPPASITTPSIEAILDKLYPGSLAHLLIPLAPGTKVPVVRHWNTRAIAEYQSPSRPRNELLSEAAEAFASGAVHLGWVIPPNHVALDADTSADAKTLHDCLSELHLLERVPLQRTRPGLHALLRLPSDHLDEDILARVGWQMPGFTCDLRVAGKSQICVAPSPNRDWIRPLPVDLAAIPTVPSLWSLPIRDRLSKGRHPTHLSAQLTRTRQRLIVEYRPRWLPLQIDEGRRRNTLFRLCCAWRGMGAEEDVLLLGLQRINTSRCKPALGTAELDLIARDVAQRY